MANSGIDGEKRSFSVVISHRTGPLDVTEPTDLVIHLGSIEKISSLHHPVAKERVALCSLESWTYTCLPPKSFNVRDAFRYLGEHLKVLRIDPAQVEKVLTGKSLPQCLKQRLKVLEFAAAPRICVLYLLHMMANHVANRPISSLLAPP